MRFRRSRYYGYKGVRFANMEEWKEIVYDRRLEKLRNDISNLIAQENVKPLYGIANKFAEAARLCKTYGQLLYAVEDEWRKKNSGKVMDNHTVKTLKYQHEKYKDLEEELWDYYHKMFNLFARTPR